MLTLSSPHCKVCARESLGRLDRNPRCQQRYDDWAVAIREKYGGLEAYIKHYRLHWQQADRPDGFEPGSSSSSSSGANGNASTTSGLSVNGSCGAGILDVQDSATIAPTVAADGAAAEPSWKGWYHFHPSMPLGEMIKILPNDWPYGIPRDCGHYVVWCRLPIIHPSLFATPDTPFAPGPSRDALYEAVSSDGIRGMIGIDWDALLQQPQQADDEEGEREKKRELYRVVGEHTVALLRKSKEIDTFTPAPASPAMTPKVVVEKSPTIPALNLASQALKQTSHLSAPPLPRTASGSEREHATDLAERAQAWAGRYVDAYVRSVWPPEQGWELCWFANPPSLRTVPGIAHLHVIARRRRK